jgi:hypothetical protein
MAFMWRYKSETFEYCSISITWYVVAVVTGTIMISSESKIEWEGRAIVQAVCRRLLTVMAWVRSQASSCGIFGGQSDTVARFLPILRFPLPILIPPTAPHST